MSNYQLFYIPSAPWLCVVGAGLSDITNFGWSLAKTDSLRVAVRFLRGKKMVNLDSLFNEFAAALQFPYYFGENWGAFDECLADFAWMEADAYVLIITDFNSVLSEGDQEQFPTLIDILQKVADEWSQAINTAEAWARPARAFHVILQTLPSDLEEARRRLRLVEVSFQEFDIQAD